MIYEVYSVFDRVLGLYQDPFLSINVGSAVRRFKAMCQNNYIAPDLVLYRLGQFDSKSCGITLLDTYEIVINGVDVINE